MQSKYKIDRDTRTLILKYIRKYDEYLNWWITERDRMLSPSPKQADGMPRGGNVSDMTLSSVEQLDKLEKSHRVKVVRAIDQAKMIIGIDIDEKAQQMLQRAIWLSCIDGRQYNFDAFAGWVACERRMFYQYKNEFINTIKNELGI